MENNSRQTMSKYVDLKNSIQTSVVHTMIQYGKISRKTISKYVDSKIVFKVT